MDVVGEQPASLVSRKEVAAVDDLHGRIGAGTQLDERAYVVEREADPIRFAFAFRGGDRRDHDQRCLRVTSADGRNEGLDLAGQGRFGPDTEWVTGIDYRLDARRSAGFTAAIRSYWPGLPDDSLAPGYTGIRPKLAPAGGAATDFLIEGPETHGLPGLVNLYGIESPGLTASLAIADEVLARLGA